jgi:hypothetical protein
MKIYTTLAKILVLIFGLSTMATGCANLRPPDEADWHVREQQLQELEKERNSVPWKYLQGFQSLQVSR